MQVTNRRAVRRGASADEINERRGTRIDRHSADISIPPIAGWEYLSTNERLGQNGWRCGPQRHDGAGNRKRDDECTDSHAEAHITYRAEGSTGDNVLKTLPDAEALRDC
ncbi:MAG: hypothetical protein JF601_06925 [Acidobacteria bacterium]|nr:hypothetical protein [Acidobacteriota bacterium]